MITFERLDEIRQSIMKSHGWADCCTPEERAEIEEAWRKMPGDFNFYSAVCRLLNQARGPGPVVTLPVWDIE
jgi:hypothetical protein